MEVGWREETSLGAGRQVESDYHRWHRGNDKVRADHLPALLPAQGKLPKCYLWLLNIFQRGYFISSHKNFCIYRYTVNKKWFLFFIENV